MTKKNEQKETKGKEQEKYINLVVGNTCRAIRDAPVDLRHSRIETIPISESKQINIT